MVMEGMEDMVDMVDMDIMERDLLKLMLNQDTSPEDMAMEDMVMEDMVMEVMDMDVDTMARERLKQSQDILEAMVVMAMAVDMVIMVEYLSFIYNPTYNFIGYKTKGIKHELVKINFFLLETFICVIIDKSFKP